MGQMKMRKKMRLREFSLPKNSWELLISDADKEEVGPELIDLVHHAYSMTHIFVRLMKIHTCAGSITVN